jgi:GT2 family glycosyltransferase/2-polyprenyl-3-methyl-5-hydroxy-6-metoxy-1,4-benzoquinol methylase
MLELDKYGYTRDASTAVWVRPDFSGIAYSDGDTAENTLAKIIREANDVSVLSPELPQYCTDWAKLYHLSPSRGNLFRPFEHLLKGRRVLEIGAGCGAISRYLGEAGAQVLALEGSPRRAAIAASRTRDLDNVTVLAERFDDFKVEEQFDVVTLIGVLEYASMFSADPDPAHGMLQRIRQLLKPDGHLFIAIENQLGLKYFAGAPEDHMGIAMYGIEGRYEHGQPKTFGKKELEHLIARSGFASSEFLSPCPDYKLPNSLITENGFVSREFDAAELAWQNARKDPQLPAHTHFNLEKTWPVVIDNQLGMDLANSFLVVASNKQERIIAERVLAYHYSTGRKADYCKQAIFVKTPVGIKVRSNRLDGMSHVTAPVGSAYETFRHILSAEQDYAEGKVLSAAFLEAALSQGWTVESFGPFLQLYLNSLRTLVASEGATADLDNVSSTLPGRYLDAVPQNVVVDNEGTPQLIDLEWEMTAGVELGHLLMRGLLLLIASATPFSSSTTAIGRRDFIIQLLATAGLTVSEQDLDRYAQAEAEFQEQVTGRNARTFLNWQPDATIAVVGVQDRAVPKLATLYYCGKESTFSESNTLSQLARDGAQTLVFDISQLGAEQLRFDPVNACQSFALDSLKLYSGNEVLASWDDNSGVPLQIIGATTIARNGRSNISVATTDDPCVIIPFDCHLYAGHPQLALQVAYSLLSEADVASSLKTELECSVEISNRQLLDRDSKIHELTAQIIEREQSEADVASSLKNELERSVEISNRQLLDRDSRIHELTAQIVEREQTESDVLSSLKNELERSIEISNRQLLDRDSRIHELTAQIVEREMELRSLDEQRTNDERHIKGLHSQIVDQNAQIDNLRAHLTELDSETQSLRKQIVDKDTHVHHLNLQIVAMHSSMSWKVSAPLRHVTRLARRAKRAKDLLQFIIRKGGGLSGTAKKASAAYQAKGLAGLLARANWAKGAMDDTIVANETREIIDRHDYQKWISFYDTLTAADIEIISNEIAGWASTPVISIIMPVYNPPLELLKEAVSSVRAQLYPHWQLCIADDASTDFKVIEYLGALEAEDARVKVVFRTENGHISHASNSALSVATGDYIALMDNDDLLPMNALYWVARTINENPDAGLIYSDEDKIDTNGVRSAPYFKSDWNEYLFRSQNMICHLGVYRRSLVEEVGNFRPGFEGAQDYDLALRCIDKLERDQIVHIPRVLYHWRIHPGSTAMAGDEKPYAAHAGVAALNEHLARKGNIGTTELLPMGLYRVHYSLPETLPLVTLVIPTRNAHVLVKQCIDSIKRLTTYPRYEIILVDNGSDEPESLEYFATIDREENIRVMRDDGPFNYSALNNKAVRIANGELIGLVNNDIEVITPGWLEEMVSIALQPNVGAVGARLWYPDNRLQHGGVVVGVGGVAGHSHKYLAKGDYGYFCRAALTQEFSAVTAACLIIKKSIFEEVDGLDEVNLKVAFNDVDFCLRVQEAGYLNIWTPFAELYHHESATRGLEDTPQKQERFMNEVIYVQSRWPRLREDYTYNPNLTLEHEDFGLAWPPRVKSLVRTEQGTAA